jgi:hypothetical protein
MSAISELSVMTNIQQIADAEAGMWAPGLDLKSEEFWCRF